MATHCRYRASLVFGLAGFHGVCLAQGKVSDIWGDVISMADPAFIVRGKGKADIPSGASPQE